MSRNIFAILRGIRPFEAVAVTAALIEAGITSGLPPEKWSSLK